MSVDDSQQSSRPTVETPRSPVTSRRDRLTKDSIQKGLQIQQRLREQRLAKQANREQQAEKNREAFPWTTECLLTMRSRFRTAAVLGFVENGVTKGTPDVWSEGFPIPQPYRAKAPGRPWGRSVNKGNKEKGITDD